LHEKAKSKFLDAQEKIQEDRHNAAKEISDLEESTRRIQEEQ